MPASLITFAHRGTSDLMSAANSAGELLNASLPTSANLARTSACASALTVSEWSRATMAGGVYAGAFNPYGMSTPAADLNNSAVRWGELPLPLEV